MNVLFRTFFVLLPLAFTHNAFALDSSSEQEVKDWYQIEFALFEHAEGARSELRYEAHQYSPLKTNDYQYYFENSYYRAGYPLSARHLSPIANELSVLYEPIKRLTRDRRTDLISSAYWQQSIDNDSATLPLKLNMELKGGRYLDGYIRVRRERFMHIEVDAFIFTPNYFPRVDWINWLRAPVAQPLGSLLIPANVASQHIDNPHAKDTSHSVNSAPFGNVKPKSSTPIIFESPISANDEPVLDNHSMVAMNVIRFRDSRRVKEGELHYIDHPALGLIASIKKIESPEVATFSYENAR